MIVERESECSTLYGLINGAVESNQGCIINLCGQPSFGKTTICKYVVNKVVEDRRKKRMKQLKKNKANNNNMQTKRTSSGLQKMKNNVPPIASVPLVISSTQGNGFLSMYNSAIRDLNDTNAESGNEETMVIFFIDECDLACNLHACSNHSAGNELYI